MAESSDVLVAFMPHFPFPFGSSAFQECLPGFMSVKNVSSQCSELPCGIELSPSRLGAQRKALPRVCHSSLGAGLEGNLLPGLAPPAMRFPPLSLRC